jgi:hypothetical protein
MLPRDIPTSPSAVQLAVQQEDPSATALVVMVAMVLTDLVAKCILRYVLSVVKNVKYPSSRERVGQFIAVTVTGRSG